MRVKVKTIKGIDGRFKEGKVYHGQVNSSVGLVLTNETGKEDFLGNFFDWNGYFEVLED